MSFLLRGNLCAAICADCRRPLSGVEIRLYRLRDDQLGRVTADPKETFAILSDNEVKAKASHLLAVGKTDEAGDFHIEIGDDTGYDGGPFEIDVVVEQVDGKAGRRPVQATLTALQPRWRQVEDGVFVAVWDYCLHHRFWCALLEALDLWMICGRVLDCETERPQPGLKVFAFDVDWIQDDDLGSATTDGTGRFTITYAGADFKKTPFPAINFEWTGGPDLYFRVETAGGLVLLAENRSRGRDKDRENAGNCFCVTLCVEEPEEEYENPIFVQIGDFNIAADIDPATGLTIVPKAGHGGPGYGFFGSLLLRGFCPKTLPSNPSQVMHYRFLYVDSADPATEVPITGSRVTEAVIGARKVPWDQFGAGIADTYQDIIIRGSGTASPPDGLPPFPGPAPHGPVPPHILVPDAQGWVRVDQRAIDSGFFNLLKWNTATAVAGGSAVAPGDQAGSPATAAKNGRIVTLFFETATDPANPATYDRQMLSVNVLVNNWQELKLLDLDQFINGSRGSCTPIKNDLDILYTVDHQLLDFYQLRITSAASIPITNPVQSGTGPRGASGTHHENVTSWPSCSYVVRLSSRRRLTDGLNDDSTGEISKTFCK